jgi:ABC-type uncharacterized transport system ATPase subunit
MPPLLEIRAITKTFPGVVANANISMTVDKGQIVALLGENGSGKTTLVQSVFGLVLPDSGEVLVNGEVLTPGDTVGAMARGIGMVHQQFHQVPVMTVAENLILGDEPTRGLLLSRRRAHAQVLALSKKYNLDVDPGAIVEDLTIGMRQRVEILKALRRPVDLLILDEPTAVLIPQEIDELLTVIKSLANSGVGVLFITHKLREVMEVADKAVVLRDGRVVGVTSPSQTDEEGLATMMVGRSVVLRVERGLAQPKEVVLSISGLKVRDDRKLITVNGIDLDVRAGEIVGIAGVEGNGQRELVEAICGMRARLEGRVVVAGHELPDLDPRGVHRLGVSHIPEDHDKHGLVSSYSVKDNLVLNRFDRTPYARGWIRDLGAVAANATKLIAEFDIRAESNQAEISSLSGGNKQKVVVARELSQETRVVVAAHPTRGLDVGSI